MVLVGPNGVGKSMLACNLGHQALIQVRTVLFTTAGQLLGDLAALDSDSTLRQRLCHYAAPDLLLIDEVGYLSYSNRHADFAGELISRRYEHKSTVVTTHRSFKEWHEVFPNAVSLIDRLVHRCEVVAIQGESYRLKEAQARAGQKTALRAGAQRKAQSEEDMTRTRLSQPATPQHPVISATIKLPTYWSPEQAAAVFEILDELRERVWGHYGAQIQKVLREDRRVTTSVIPSNIDDSDVPF